MFDLVEIFSLDIVQEYSAVPVAALLGALLGLERELAGKDPSVRTFSLIALASCLFTLNSFLPNSEGIKGDPARIAAQIVTGIGFLGAGTIFRSGKGTHGLTTAALMWLTAAIGMSAGFGRFGLAFIATAWAICLLLSIRIVRSTANYLSKNKYQEHECDD
jgi:putative Mg2+ transporter-C (MgtC) family protein